VRAERADHRAKKDCVLENFTENAAGDLQGPEWLRRRRTEAYRDLLTMPMPSSKEELWRYSPVDSFDLGAYRPSNGVPEPLDRLGQAFVDGLSSDLSNRSALAVVHNGRLISFERSEVASGTTIGGLADAVPEDGAFELGHEALGSALVDDDVFSRLNDAFAPDAVVLDVPPGVKLEGPLVVIHWCDGTDPGPAGGPMLATFPRTLVRVGAQASGSVVEIFAGAPDTQAALVAPVTELVADGGGSLSYVSLQVLGDKVWHIGRLAGRAGRDCRLRTFTVGLGGDYDRLRTDAAALEPGAHCEIRSAYLGTGGQVHDVRTQQDHRAPHTSSDLLCKGAVGELSRSVYSGLIKVRHGAVRTEAFQTNHNLVLDPGAHADSVPNLDIEENDVRCSHASTVGPIDPDQRYYLESRGVPPDRAERLIVLGFFEDVLAQSPVPESVERLRQEVGLRLLGMLGAGSGSDEDDDRSRDA